LVKQHQHINKPSNKWLEYKQERKLQHPCNNFKHISEVRRVGAGGLMFNEVKYDHKKQQGIRLSMNKFKRSSNIAKDE
jgi:hypothetical protein